MPYGGNKLPWQRSAHSEGFPKYMCKGSKMACSLEEDEDGPVTLNLLVQQV